MKNSYECYFILSEIIVLHMLINIIVQYRQNFNTTPMFVFTIYINLANFGLTHKGNFFLRSIRTLKSLTIYLYINNRNEEIRCYIPVEQYFTRNRCYIWVKFYERYEKVQIFPYIYAEK